MSARKTKSGIKPGKGERMSYDAIFKGSLKCPAHLATMAPLPCARVPDGPAEAYFKDVFGGAVF